MVNRKNWLGILAVLLVFTMTVVGCDEGTVGGNTNGNGNDNGNDTWSKLTAGSGSWQNVDSDVILRFSGDTYKHWGWNDDGMATISVSGNTIRYGGGLESLTVTFITNTKMTLSDMTDKGGDYRKLEGTYNRIP
jgi:hypothetical protein